MNDSLKKGLRVVMRSPDIFIDRMTGHQLRALAAANRVVSRDPGARPAGRDR